ncbi:MAG: M23 family metallopeptidase [Alphaproteobacteria bacterium]|nr:M23 family metallopeptidase [Alphaproteobacteria bacterium]MDE2499250.1 M23 family metallopeptidase [Alphaproteobacteria bacterium]
MAETLVERVWAWLHETFPERQIYIRSDGRVQFFTFGPTLQATLAGLSLIFLGWVAFATVNVIFKDRIIAAKDHRYQQMQSAYENRVADLQLSYDEVNGALVSAEDKFKATADELQAKQGTIMHFLERKQQVDAALAGDGTFGPTLKSGTADASSLDGGTASDSLGATAPPTGMGGSDSDDDGGSSDLTVSPQPVKPQPRTAKPTHTSFLDLGGAVGRIAGALFGVSQPAPVQEATYARHPVLKLLAAQTNRVRRLSMNETNLMVRTQGEVADGVGEIQAVLRRTGINPTQFVQRIEASEGVGGPDIPLNSVHIEGISDGAFQQAYLNAYAVLDEMNQLLKGMRHVPLTTPVSGSQYDISSGFGPRVDPFTGHLAFHPGLDFAGPWGSIVRATAPGTVVWAGARGSYGNMVEIDHGFGIHTRYGHLSSILVHVGAKVAKGAPIGDLGSTGRSTGPHVHYEVWYDDVVRNPRKFIEAGRYVLQQE